jgi:regulator of nucleoside diphosphate kinase
VPADVVTMYSQVLVRDRASAEVSKLTLCYPADAEPDTGFISVLSPMGAALIGRRVGERVRSALPAGQERELVIETLLFQPEASGDYTS